jgi:hypothetical protein
VTRSFQDRPVGALESSSSISYQQAFRERLRFALTGHYAVTGGVTEEDQLVLPRVHTADLSAVGTLGLHHEMFSLAITGSRGWISTGHRTALLTVNNGWRHSFRHRVESEVSAGLSVLGGDAAEQHGVVPTAAITVRRELAHARGATGGRITLRWGPVLDPTTGVLLQRLEGSAALAFAPVTATVLSAGGGLAFSPDEAPPAPNVVAQGAVGIAHKLTSACVLSAGVRVAALPNVEWAGLIMTTLSEQGVLRLF